MHARRDSCAGSARALIINETGWTVGPAAAEALNLLGAIWCIDRRRHVPTRTEWRDEPGARRAVDRLAAVPRTGALGVGVGPGSRRDAPATDTALFAAVTMECVLRITHSLTTGTRRTVNVPRPWPDRERRIFPSPALSAHPCSRRRRRGQSGHRRQSPSHRVYLRTLGTRDLLAGSSESTPALLTGRRQLRVSAPEMPGGGVTAPAARHGSGGGEHAHDQTYGQGRRGGRTQRTKCIDEITGEHMRFSSAAAVMQYPTDEIVILVNIPQWAEIAYSSAPVRQLPHGHSTIA